MKKQIITVYTLSFFLVTVFYLAIKTGDFYFILLIFFVFIIAISLLIFLIKNIIQAKKYPTKQLLFSSLIGVLALGIVIFRPIDRIVELTKSPIIVSGFCEHTVTSDLLYLRKDNTFDYKAGGFLEYKMYYGNYLVQDNKVLLLFDDKLPENFNNTLIYDKGYLKQYKSGKTNHIFKLKSNQLFKD